MNSRNLQALPAASGRSESLWSYCRGGERIAILFFAYLAFLGVAFHFSRQRLAACAAIPLLIAIAAMVESRFGNRWTSYLRDWLLSGLVLIAYWEIDLFASPIFPIDRQENWLAFDRWLLNEASLRHLIEFFGPVVPTVLEACYFFLYTIPPFCLAMLYLYRQRGEVDRFYRMFLSGALGAYAMLPLVPMQSPRIVAAGLDSPGFESFFRTVNVWVLDHLDIATSVFPSGHVAVAFASYYGIRRALPDVLWVQRTVLGLALGVLLATVYGRYHYTADGLASVLITTLVFRAAEVLDRRD